MSAPAEPNALEIVFVRVPAHLKKQLKAVAARDGNSLSATARRILSVGLRADQQEAGRRG